MRSQSSSASASAPDARNKRTYERDRARDYIPARQHRLEEERARAHLQRQREREEEARQLAEAEARRAAKEARRRQRLAEQLRHEEQKRLQQQRAERRRSERTRRAREIASAWSSHETRWSGLLSQSHNQNGASLLTFERIPWPVAVVVVEPPPPQDGRRTRTRTRRTAALDELLRPEAIREFLLSPAHSPEVSSKDRIRAALRRWHPDKFARVLGLVVECDKDAVAEGVGIVVRCLNEMLERENHA